MNHYNSLAGKKIVITRAPHQAPEMEVRLRAHRAVPIRYPCIMVVPPEDVSQLDDALHHLLAGQFEWLVLTSANTVRAIADRLEVMGNNGSLLAQIAAIGPITASTAHSLLGVEVALLPDEYTAEALAEVLKPAVGTRILLPQADLAEPVLSETLIAAGAAVHIVEAYQTVIGTGGEDVPRLLQQGQIDAVTFTSPSTVHNFLLRLMDEGGSVGDLERVCIACIGPVTAESALESDLSIDVVPKEHTLDSLIHALAEFYASNRS